MKKYMILPSNSDLNRGDQALIWNTMELAQKSGCIGEFYMLAYDRNLTKQSQDIGIKVVEPILKHPSRKFKSKENIEYNISLVFKWGLVATVDLLKSLLILSRFTRKFAYLLLSKEEKRTMEVIKDVEAVFIKGGGFIHSFGKFTDFYTIYYALYHIALAQSLKKPVFVMPNSFGPFNGIGVKMLVRKVLKKCNLVTVRESISKKMLDDIAINSLLYPDLGFFLEKNKKQHDVISVIRYKYSNYSLVGITARPYRFPSSKNPTEKYKSYIQNMISFSKWLYANYFLPVYVEHTLSTNSHENDGSCINEITSGLRTGEYTIVSDRDFTCRDLKAIYSEFDYVVGTRFHSVIFSLAEGVPSIAITYGGNKGQGIMHDLNLSDYAIPMSEFSVEKAISSFKRLNENRNSICLHLNESIEILEKNYQNLIKEVNEKLYTL